MATMAKCKKCGKYTSGEYDPCDLCNPEAEIEVREKGEDYTVYKKKEANGEKENNKEG